MLDLHVLVIAAALRRCGSPGRTDPYRLESVQGLALLWRRLAGLMTACTLSKHPAFEGQLTELAKAQQLFRLRGGSL